MGFLIDYSRKLVNLLKIAYFICGSFCNLKLGSLGGSLTQFWRQRLFLVRKVFFVSCAFKNYKIGMGFIKFIFKIMGVFTIWQLNSINNQAFKCFLFPWRWILFYILYSVYCRYYDTLPPYIDYAVASHYYKKLFCENSDVRGFL